MVVTGHLYYGRVGYTIYTIPYHTIGMVWYGMVVRSGWLVKMCPYIDFAYLSLLTGFNICVGQHYTTL